MPRANRQYRCRQRRISGSNMTRMRDSIVALFQHRPEERPLVLQETPLLAMVSNRLLAIRIAGRLLPILFIRSKRREREHRQRDVVRAFVRKEIAMVGAAELVDQRDPHLRVGLELGCLERIDFIPEEAGNHLCIPMFACKVANALPACMDWPHLSKQAMSRADATISSFRRHL